MTLNPRNYDPNELREMAGNGGSEFEFGRTPTRLARGPDELMRSNHHRELLLLEEAAPEELHQKPYLTALPGSYAAEVLTFEWLEYLIAKVGYSRAAAALSYYASIGWLSDDAERGLREYLRGIGGPEEGAVGRLTMDDHLLGLVYVARLASMT